jgi:hypothetical protein
MAVNFLNVAVIKAATYFLGNSLAFDAYTRKVGNENYEKSNLFYTGQHITMYK